MDTEIINGWPEAPKRWQRMHLTSLIQLREDKIKFAQIAAVEIERQLCVMLHSLGVDVQVRISWQHQLDEAGKLIPGEGFFKMVGDTSIQPPTNHGSL